eukprot:1536344-Rhodomonas_salina.1
MADGPKKNPECVRVVVRCRPMSRKEVEDNRKRIIEMNLELGEITVKNPEADPRELPKPFTFDQAYLFETTAQPIVDSVLTGYNGTVFAYGQTGTGKTHTMEGQWEPHEMRGIIPRAFNRIFERIEQTHDQNFLVRASFLEIYNEEVRDLLSKDPKNKLELKEDVDRGVYVKDLTSYVVKVGISERRIAGAMLSLHFKQMTRRPPKPASTPQVAVPDPFFVQCRSNPDEPGFVAIAFHFQHYHRELKRVARRFKAYPSWKAQSGAFCSAVQPLQVKSPGFELKAL